MTYLDTSVLAAYYYPETFSTQAEEAILRAPQPAISQLVEVELHSALARKIREGALTKAEGLRIVTQFRLHVTGAYYLRLPLTAVHYEIASDWIGRFTTPLRTLDALHLAVSFSSDAVLLTSDAGLAKAAKHFGVRLQFIS